MLAVRLYFGDGSRWDAEITDRRAYPKLVKLDYGEVTAKLFVRRGDSVGAEADEYDEAEPVQCFLTGKGESDTDLFTESSP